MSYWVCFYHVVWATRGRHPILDPEEFGMVEAVVRSAFEGQRVVIHGVACMPDHVHVAASIPPRLAVAEVAGHWKGSSSHLLNQHRRAAGHPETFAWQAEYGVHTFGTAALPKVIAYIENQPQHHHLGTLWPGLERTATDPPPARPVPSPGGASFP